MPIRGCPSFKAELGVAVGADHQHSRPLHEAGQVSQQPQRVGIGPVQVVEDEEDRLFPGNGEEEADNRVVQAKALLVRAERAGYWHVGQRGAHLGHEVGDRRGAGAKLLPHVLGVRART